MQPCAGAGALPALQTPGQEVGNASELQACTDDLHT